VGFPEQYKIGSADKGLFLRRGSVPQLWPGFPFTLCLAAITCQEALVNMEYPSCFACLGITAYEQTGISSHIPGMS
jgi:hypothetical protein